MLRKQLEVQIRGGLQPWGTDVLEDREATSKCSVRWDSPHTNKSLNSSESSKSPYPSGLKADLKECLLTDCSLPGSFPMHVS